MRSCLLAATAAVALSTAPMAASASVLVDFTDSSLYGPLDLAENFVLGSGNVDVTVSSTGTGSDLTFDGFDGDASVTLTLAFDNDGIGVDDDEITYDSEEVTVSFSRNVLVVAFHFLDLYFADPDIIDDAEVAEVWQGGVLVHSFTASLVFQQQGGYRYASVPPFLAGPLSPLVFKAAIGNDNVGYADYALAAIEITAVPLPAAFPLFGTGLAALGLAGWRRRTASRRAVASRP